MLLELEVPEYALIRFFFLWSKCLHCLFFKLNRLFFKFWSTDSKCFGDSRCFSDSRFLDHGRRERRELLFWDFLSVLFNSMSDFHCSTVLVVQVCLNYGLFNLRWCLPRNF